MKESKKEDIFCPVCGARMIEGMTVAYCSNHSCDYEELMTERD